MSLSQSELHAGMHIKYESRISGSKTTVTVIQNYK
jgi:hypothetical protein